jgi:hypothetical protein
VPAPARLRRAAVAPSILMRKILVKLYYLSFYAKGIQINTVFVAFFILVLFKLTFPI